MRLQRGSQWGGGLYGYRLKFWLFYGYRLIFFQLRLTKKLKINFFCFKELNINKPVFFVSLSKIKVLGSSLDEISYLIDHTFKYFTSNTILPVEMSTVTFTNLGNSFFYG